jgi:hypothetical protein
LATTVGLIARACGAKASAGRRLAKRHRGQSLALLTVVFGYVGGESEDFLERSILL